jgi:hypothetical protein
MIEPKAMDYINRYVPIVILFYPKITCPFKQLVQIVIMILTFFLGRRGGIYENYVRRGSWI